MAKVLDPLSDSEVNKMTVVNLKTAYKKLADFCRKILNGNLVYCSHCGQWRTRMAFYSSDVSADHLEHYACKECILDECTDYDKKTGIRTDNREKTIETFKRLNWYFDEGIYNDQLQSLSEQTGEKVRGTAVQQWIVICRSLNDYKNKTFKDSVFLDSDDESIQLASKRKPRKEIIKLFGSGFTTEDYLYLQDQYDDWCARTEVDGKSQQTYIIRICFKLLDIYKAQKSGKDTEKLDKSLNDLLLAANLQPRQNVGNASTDSLTFSQLISKWELERPIPTPDPELCDVSGIGKKIRVWFGGWLANAIGLDVPQSQEYLDEVNKYTVTKPSIEEKEGSSAIYQKMYGSGE